MKPPLLVSEVVHIGITDNGNIKGITKNDLKALNQMISNVCSQKIEPTISVFTENIFYQDKIIVIITVPMGENNFYIANNKDLWVKMGADKRRAKREELKRLLQESNELYADEQTIPNSSIDDLDLKKIKEYVEEIEKLTGIIIEGVPLENIMNNLKLLIDDKCTLAGMLLFGKNIFKLSYQALIGAVSWDGNTISGENYLDRDDIKGNIVNLFRNSFLFIRRNLRKEQKGRGFNTNGILEIPEVAIEEALINAIVHRNYFIAANIRIMIFDNRLEIVSPGVLPNTLSVESIKSGINIQRNPILNSLIRDLKGIPYSGMGTGIPRILRSCQEENIKVDFINDTLGQQFKVIFYRK